MSAAGIDEQDIRSRPPAVNEDANQAGELSRDNGRGSHTNIGREVIAQQLADHTRTSEANDDEDVLQEAQPEETAYVEPAPEELLAPPDLKPFFTLVEDPETGECYHPTVHYLFADDDQDILTSAGLEAIGQAAGSDVDSEERFVLLDMAADGKAVKSATSLSPTWQGLKITSRQAPSWGETTNAADKGLMLKISGREVADAGAEKESRAGVVGLDELMRRFSEGLDSLDEIIGRDDGQTTGQEDVVTAGQH